jgi:hypothetical protein
LTLGGNGKVTVGISGFLQTDDAADVLNIAEAR